MFHELYPGIDVDKTMERALEVVKALNGVTIVKSTKGLIFVAICHAAVWHMAIRQRRRM